MLYRQVHYYGYSGIKHAAKSPDVLLPSNNKNGKVEYLVANFNHFITL